MRGIKALQATALLATAIGLSHCSQASGDDDDDAGESGSGGSKGGSTASGGSSGTLGGSTAARGGTGTGGSTSPGGSGGTGANGGTGGTGGSVTGGSGGASGSGTPPIAGATACAMPELIAVADPPPASIDEATFLAQWPALMCASMKPCCTATGVAYDEAKCLAYAATVFEGTEGLYDGFAAAACLAGLKLASGTCGNDLMTDGAPTACTLAYRGSGAHGSGCTRESDCAPDPRGPVVCDRFTSECTVAIVGKLGDACHVGCETYSGLIFCGDTNPPAEPGVTVVCAADLGLRCVDATADDMTGPGTCQPAIPVGCDCDEPFDETLDCNGKGWCDSDAGVCVARVGMGEPCSFADQCAVDLYCPGTTGGVCMPKKKYGEPCIYDSDCVGGTCDFDLCGLDNGDTHEWFRDAYCDGVGT